MKLVRELYQTKVEPICLSSPNSPAWKQWPMAVFLHLHLSIQHYRRKKRQQLAISPAWGLTDHLMSSLSPHLHTVPTCNPSTGEANARTGFSLRPGWATDSKTLSKGKIKTLVIMISEHFLLVNMSQKRRKESNFTLLLSWDNWLSTIKDLWRKRRNHSADCLSS